MEIESYVCRSPKNPLFLGANLLQIEFHNDFKSSSFNAFNRQFKSRSKAFFRAAGNVIEKHESHGPNCV